MARGQPDSLILRRIGKTSGNVARGMVNAYYDTLFFVAKADLGDAKARRRLKQKPYPSLLRTELSKQLSELFTQFDRYYAIRDLKLFGLGTNRSFLSDEANFQKFRQIFLKNRVRFALADVQDADFYVAAAKWLKEIGGRTLAISTSNIFDLQSESMEATSLNKDYATYVAVSCAFLLGEGVEGPIHYRQTRGWKNRHRFEYHVVHAPEDARKLKFKPVSKWHEDFPYRISPYFNRIRRVLNF